ncbi:MAG: ATP-binding protein [Actinomycetaceae bacterium]|nr:ATP-binding protein [Actinomycetaceae bacterium]
MNAENSAKQKKNARAERGAKRKAARIARRDARKAGRNTGSLVGFEAVLPSGVLWNGGKRYSLIVSLSDITYQAASFEVQEDLWSRWGRILNTLGADVDMQITAISSPFRFDEKKPTHAAGETWWASELASIRREATLGRDLTVSERYMTLSVESKTAEEAQARLIQLSESLSGDITGLNGCRASRLTRPEVVALASSRLRPKSADTFDPEAKISARDHVAPWSAETLSDGTIEIASDASSTFYRTLYVRDYPPKMNDRLIADLLALKLPMSISLHLSPYASKDWNDLIGEQIASMEMQINNEEASLERRGYDKSQVRHDLLKAYDAAKELQADMETSNQKMFDTVLAITILSSAQDSLDAIAEQVQQVMSKHSVRADVAKYMEREGFTTTLPFGSRRLPMSRNLTTADAAILIPFTTQELLHESGLYYGINAQSGMPITVDRSLGINGNGFILGTSGSGKSQAAKMEITNILSRTTDDVLIIDPENEYEPVVSAYGGQKVEIYAGSPHAVNPFDRPTGSSTREKAEFILSFVGLLIAGSDGLTSGEKSVIDRAVRKLYRVHKDSTPTLTDLANELASSGKEEGAQLAQALEIYTEGSLATFAQMTNVDIDNRLVAFDISKLGEEMKTVGMMVILEKIWERITANKERGVRTWIYIDEFHLLFSNPYSAAYFRSLYKRARKWGAMPTGITQNIEELLSNEQARLMLANSDFLLLFGQSSTDADALAELFGLSDEQERYYTHVQPGCGLVKSGYAVVPLNARISTDTQLYKLFSTSFAEREAPQKVELRAS